MHVNGTYTYDLFDAPHGFSPAWTTIEYEVKQHHEDRSLVALIPGNQQVGFHDDYINGPSPFCQARKNAAWVAR
jgi:hypothetical protein